MAAYDFTCQNCGTVFSDIMLSYVPELVTCPKCKKTDVLRHFPAPAVHIFYSPMHPRYKRGMSGHKLVPVVKPQFRPNAPYLQKQKRKAKKDAS